MNQELDTLESVHDFVKDVVISGGTYAFEKQQNAIVDFKNGDPQDVVTNIDHEIDTTIRQRITEAFPQHGFYSEESGVVSENEAHMWSIDPIDGTSNFTRGIPHYACCVSYLENNEVRAAGVYNPATKECFTYQNGEVFLNATKISVSNTISLKDAYVIFHPGRKEEMREWAGESLKVLLQHAQKNINLASAALDLCFLATGRVDMVIYGTLTTLDVAGAVAVVRASGGEVYNYETRKPVLFLSVPQRIIATATPELLEDYFRQR